MAFHDSELQESGDGNAVRRIHPGEILREDMEDCSLTAKHLADSLRIKIEDLMAILGGQRALSADMALRLARYFGTSAEYWLNLQKSYDLRRARQAHGAHVGREVAPGR